MFAVVSAPAFTRPADTTAYADGDLVANSTTAGSVTPLVFPIPVGLGKSVEIIGACLKKTDQTDVANAEFRLHLYGSSPTPANGDNAAWSTDIADYLGSLDLVLMVAHTDDAYTRTYVTGANVLKHFMGANKVIYGLVEADAGYSPASEEVFTASLILDIKP